MHRLLGIPGTYDNQWAFGSFPFFPISIPFRPLPSFQKAFILAHSAQPIESHRESAKEVCWGSHSFFVKGNKLVTIKKGGKCSFQRKAKKFLLLPAF